MNVNKQIYKASLEAFVICGQRGSRSEYIDELFTLEVLDMCQFLQEDENIFVMKGFNSFSKLKYVRKGLNMYTIHSYKAFRLSIFSPVTTYFVMSCTTLTLSEKK